MKTKSSKRTKCSFLSRQERDKEEKKNSRWKRLDVSIARFPFHGGNKNISERASKALNQSRESRCGHKLPPNWPTRREMSLKKVCRFAVVFDEFQFCFEDSQWSDHRVLRFIKPSPSSRRLIMRNASGRESIFT
jgi:hypothetical protein